MPRSFAEIQASEDFQKETPEDQAAIRREYYDTFIRPKVVEGGDDPEAVFEEFSIEHPIGKVVPTVVTEDVTERPTTNVRQTMAGQYPGGIQDRTEEQAVDGESVPEQRGGVTGWIADLVSGGEKATGYANEFHNLATAPEFQGSVNQAKTGEDDDILDTLVEGLGSGVNSLFGGSDDMISRAQKRGGKLMTDDKGNQFIEFPSGRYIVNKAGLDTQDVISTAAQIAPAVKGAQLVKGGLGLGKTMAAQGGIQGAINYGQQKLAELTGGNDVDAGEVALNSALGAGGELIMPVARGTKALFSRGTGEATGPALKESLKIADEAGIPITTSDLINTNEIGGGGMVRSLNSISDKFDPFMGGRVRKQEALIPEKAKDIFSSPEAAANYTDEAMLASFNKGKARRMGEISQKYESVKTEMGDEPIPVRNTSQAIDDILKEWEKPGVMVDKADIEYLRDIQAKLTEAPQDLVTLRDNRTRMRNSFGSGMNKMMGKSDLEKAGRKIYEAVGKDMDEGVAAKLGEDVAKDLRKADKDWAILNGDLENAKLAQAIKKGDADPEKLRTTLKTFNKGELEALNRTLNEEGRDTLRAGIFKNIDDASKTEDGVFSAARMQSEINKNMDAIRHFYPERKVKEIEGFQKLLATAKGAKASESIMNNGGMQMFMAATSAAATGGASLGVQAGGIAAKGIMNSRPMRNALLRMSNMKPGSMAYYKTVRQIDAILANQKSREEDE